MFYAILLVIIVLTILIVTYNHFYPLQPYFRSTGKNSHFSDYHVQLDPLTPFDCYLANAKKVIVSARTIAAKRSLYKKTMTEEEAQEYLSDEVINLVVPFHWQVDPHKFPEGPKGAIVFIHGSTLTPASIRGLARSFNQNGYDVRSVLLPGHGTVPGDSLAIHPDDVKDLVHYATLTAQQVSSHVILIGESIGGAASLLEVINNNKVTKAIVFVPAVKPKKESIINIINILLTIFPIHKLIPRFAYVSTHLEATRNKNEYEYTAMTWSMAITASKMTQELRARLLRKKITTPVLIICSSVDSVVDVATIQDYFNNRFSSQSELLIFSEKTLQEERIMHNEHVTTLLPIEHRSPDGKTILSYSHLNLTRSPFDRLYGWQSKEKLGCEYLGDGQSIASCQQGNFTKLGELSDENLAHHDDIERLTYNPSYEIMLKKIFAFLEK